MTTYQEEQLSSDKLIVKVSEENPESTKLIPAFEEGIKKLKLIVTEIEKIRPLQEQDQSGVAANKSFTEEKLRNSIHEISGAIFSYADAKGDSVLKGRMNYKINDLKNMVPGVLVSAANTVLIEARKLLPADLAHQGISAGELKDYEDMVAYFDSITESPRSAIIDQSGITKRLGELFGQSSALRKNTLNPLNRQFRTKDPAFYAKFKAARKIIRQGPDRPDTTDTAPKS